MLNAPSLEGWLNSPDLVVDRVNGETVVRYICQGEHLLVDTARQSEYYLEDAMNSIVGIANSGGILSASFEYASFGVEFSASSALTSYTCGDFQFLGMCQDPNPANFNIPE